MSANGISLITEPTELTEPTEPTVAQETTTGYEGAYVLPPIRGFYNSVLVIDYPATVHNTIWGSRGFASNYSRQHIINNYVKDDCIEHIITDDNNKIQATYITSKPNINSKQKISNEKTCSICAEDFNIDDNMLDDRCFNKCCSNHFHTSCLNKWILNNFEQNKHPFCPLCRKSIKKNYNNLYPSIISYDIEAYSQDIETVFETKSVVQYFGPSTSTSTSTTNNQQSSNQLPTISNVFSVDTINYKYELNLETKIYSIYDLYTEELKMTLTEQDVNIVIQQSGYSHYQVIKALVEEEGDIVNAIMSLTM